LQKSDCSQIASGCESGDPTEKRAEHPDSRCETQDFSGAYRNGFYRNWKSWNLSEDPGHIPPHRAIDPFQEPWRKEGNQRNDPRYVYSMKVTPQVDFAQRPGHERSLLNWNFCSFLQSFKCALPKSRESIQERVETMEK
jgi:hypothetical protein